jgi:hypothetical protein
MTEQATAEIQAPEATAEMQSPTENTEAKETMGNNETENPQIKEAVNDLIDAYENQIKPPTDGGTPSQEITGRTGAWVG